MKIENIRIQNFRAHKDTLVSLGDLNMFVGKNDAGKSTILEALDIFFNDKDANKKIDAGDRCMQAEEGEEITISVCFSEFPTNIVIDDTNKTTLEDEHILNKEGYLEIRKRYTGKTLKTNTFICANHPTAKLAKELLLKKRPELKEIVDDNKYQCDNKTKNANLRKAIWENCGDLELKEIEIPTDGEDAKKIQEKLSGYLPIYSLFQSDRANNDSDTEVQDPMKATIKEILGVQEMQDKLKRIADDVQNETKKITEQALKKLKEMDPEIAKYLKVVIPETLKWPDVFRGIQIFDGDDIPLNKRGSGVKRLILLNFFRVKAERKKDEGNNARRVIYAIEEPETSQHFDYQKFLMDALKELSANTQIFLTTHNAEIVKSIFSGEGKISKNFKILHVEKKSKPKKIKEMEEGKLGYLSVNEVNHIAFEIYDEAFHNELYGLIESRNAKELCKLPKHKKWIRKYKDGKTKECDVSLQEYIRHSIHHPENKSNDEYTDEELKKSINTMYEKFPIAVDEAQ